jgi:hypothetical protein
MDYIFLNDPHLDEWRDYVADTLNLFPEGSVSVNYDPYTGIPRDFTIRGQGEGHRFTVLVSSTVIEEWRAQKFDSDQTGEYKGDWSEK